MLSRMGQLFRLALRNLVGYPLRTLLTTLGIVFGVGSVIAMMAMGVGAEQALLAEIGRLGIRNVILNTVPPPQKSKDTQTSAWQFNRYGLTFKDEKLIRGTVPGLARVLPVHKRKETAWHGSRRAEVMLHAVEAEHMELFGLDVVRGRNLGDVDGADQKRVCVIRSGLLKQLKVFEDALDTAILVGDEYYRVIGILADEEFLGYARKAMALDQKALEVYVPYQTVFNREGTRTMVERQGSRELTDVELHQIVVCVEDIDDVLTTARMLQRVLEKNHEEKDWELVVPLEVLAQRRKTQQVFNIALIFIASISLLVGGIGIANIMLATVTERTREIGVRRALGAQRRHIVAQFLTETATIALLGGMLGVGFGFFMNWVLEKMAGWEGVVACASLVLALSISMGVGVVSGIYPARRAAYLDPIEALRHE